MKQYLKMADVFEGAVTANHGDNYNGWSVVETSHGLSIDESGDGGFEAKTADYVAHAINSHDELVQMRQDLLEALEAVIDDKAPLYHDCIDNGESECGWCIARKAIAKAKGGAV